MGMQLLAPLRKNMRPRLLPWMDQILHRKRSLIETVYDQLGNFSQIEHGPYRSATNFLSTSSLA